jgi:hypothetical protein
MSSLVQTLLTTVGSAQLKQLSAQIGADEATTQKAVTSAIPLLVGALAKNAATPEGAQALMTSITKDHDGSILDNLGISLGNPLVAKGGAAILGNLLGGKRLMIEQALSSATGMNPTATSNLLNLLTPLVMGIVGKVVRQESLDVNGLVKLLSAESSQTVGVVGGMLDLLDGDSKGGLMGNALNMGSKLGKLFG